MQCDPRRYLMRRYVNHQILSIGQRAIFPSSQPSPDTHMTILAIPRADVEATNLAPFLDTFGVNKLPSGAALASMMGDLVFTIMGYEDTEEGLSTIPEVRNYYKALYARWPFWLYFCSLEVDALTVMTTCILPSITTMRTAGGTQYYIRFDPAEMAKFLYRSFPPMNEMCKRAERDIFDRSMAIFDYFGWKP